MNSQNLTVTFSYIRLLFNWKADIWQYLPGKRLRKINSFTLPCRDWSGLHRWCDAGWNFFKKRAWQLQRSNWLCIRGTHLFYGKIRSGKRRASGPLFFRTGPWNAIIRWWTGWIFLPPNSSGSSPKANTWKLQTCFALAHHPRFLILDEPLEGFDPVFRKNFLSIMQDILNEDVGIFYFLPHYRNIEKTCRLPAVCR